ncbi:hypothetical protein HGP14_13545 [Rhizobium sp. P32RR-XVIII]|nr:hypothetical protein [Rhizobium sp. P32RR-XVIII]NLS04376.1 hypothetical protein [Rhizobium sp. P32RR-XVIII]
MDCNAIEESARPVSPSSSALVSSVADWVRAKLFHPSRIDLDSMPDRVKRDLGFLDGRDPRYEDEF